MITVLINDTLKGVVYDDVIDLAKDNNLMGNGYQNMSAIAQTLVRKDCDPPKLRTRHLWENLIKPGPMA
jgi:hypothetical protein